MLVNCLFVGCGGFLGSIFRYLCGFINVGVDKFPLVTLGINVIGSFVILFFAGIFAKTFPVNEQLMLFMRVGLCGGFTTFSTFSAETLSLLESGEIVLAIIYAVASCAFCVFAAFLGELVSTAIAV